jgi:AraC family transcriptional regulator, regulatory protein of adaptative response / DNA-3-methyladenine glycosylase II
MLDANACYRAIRARDARFDGRFFTGVKTTGIYCRPICPARCPKRENVVFFPSAAAAAEAGFRPCLRCRPETSPDHGAWRGTSSTVARALGLIEAGALDEDDVASLAERVGVGERQLRRLFAAHVGASPIAVAQTRRVHLAKQLLHETSLSMTDVAHASGFGSVRRFNATFLAMFGRAPSRLRRTSSKGRSGPLVLRLPYRKPYDWDAILSFLAARAIPGVEAVDRDRYARTIAIAGATGTVAIEPTSNAHARVELSLSRVDVVPDVVARVRRLFDLAADPVAIGAHLSEDPLLARLVDARPGLRVPGAWDVLELAIRAILGQQITVALATALAGKLVKAFGERLATDDPRLTHVFPRARVLARADVASLGMPQARAEAVRGFAAALDRNPHLFSARRGLDDSIRALCTLSGIGEWTAQYIAMRELREPDAFPAADIGLLRALEDRYGRRPTPEELRARAERWRPWRAYAALHLWSKSDGRIVSARAFASRSVDSLPPVGAA